MRSSSLCGKLHEAVLPRKRSGAQPFGSPLASLRRAARGFPQAPLSAAFDHQFFSRRIVHVAVARG